MLRVYTSQRSIPAQQVLAHVGIRTVLRMGQGFPPGDSRGPATSERRVGGFDICCGSAYAYRRDAAFFSPSDPLS